MTVELITNNLKFVWSEAGNTVNIFAVTSGTDSGECVASASVPDGVSVAYFKGYVKRWLKDNDRFNDDGYLLTVISRGYWK